MSRSVDLFIDFADDPESLFLLLEQALVSPPLTVEPGRWALGLADGAVAELSKHSYLDDGDLYLTRYRWVVSIPAGHSGSLEDHEATKALRTVAEVLRRSDVRVLLVLDLMNRVELGAKGEQVERPDSDQPPAADTAEGGIADALPTGVDSAWPALRPVGAERIG